MANGRGKCVIIIDGSNFYFKLKGLKLHDLVNFNFSKFAKDMAGKDKIVSATYYIGAVKTDGSSKTARMFASQRKLLANLRRNGFRYSLGYLLKSEGKFHEKGVDVNMAVDILVATYEKLCNRIIIVSSDTDLLPAVKKAREKGKKVEYVGFSYQPSVAMVANCDKSRLLTKEGLTAYLSVLK